MHRGWLRVGSVGVCSSQPLRPAMVVASSGQTTAKFSEVWLECVSGMDAEPLPAALGGISGRLVAGNVAWPLG